MAGYAGQMPQGGEQNLLMQPVQAQAQGGMPDQDAWQQNEARQMRQLMQQMMGAKPSPQTSQQLQAIMQTARDNPYMQTDDFMYGLDMLARRHGTGR